MKLISVALDIVIYQGCIMITTCTGEKNYYKAKVADAKYRELLVTFSIDLPRKVRYNPQKSISPIVKNSAHRI